MPTLRPELAAIPLACPLDGRALHAGEHGLRCDRGHDFNLSRHGYVDLLPVKLKPSKDPGDSRAMVRARTRVLCAGVFEPLALALIELAFEILEPLAVAPQSALLIDAGCGDGYYTSRLRDALGNHSGGQVSSVLGTDISRWAVRAACRQDTRGAYAVANNKRLPVLVGRASLITSLFGFETWRPWARLQSEGQYVLTASAGPEHLIELRERIYEAVRISPVSDDAEATAAGYRKCREVNVCRIRDLESQALRYDLLDMTPHRHRMDATTHDALDLSSLDRVTVDVVLRLYRR